MKETRYQALIDNKYESNDNLWHKSRWTLKFFRCNKDIGGIYYSIYSDINQTGHPNFNETLKDPLTNKRIYSTNRCEDKENRSKYVLLTKEYEIKEIKISCNRRKSIGQISFGNEGKVYSRLSAYENEYKEYEIENRCKIKLISENKDFKEIIIEANNGFTYINK
ncbi:type II secretion system protein [Arcobacter sp. LA11]|uniref:type II secretion system protein n=1 Tax=Arcobacter sp. LA11 TaxID=1898176 RepID=UPI002159F913|nr:type II secretion system protein [Arcobacter sp. LA11]